jgi:hypothetical protein
MLVLFAHGVGIVLDGWDRVKHVVLILLKKTEKKAHGLMKAAGGVRGALETDASAGDVVSAAGLDDEALENSIGL